MPVLLANGTLAYDVVAFQAPWGGIGNPRRVAQAIDERSGRWSVGISAVALVVSTRCSAGWPMCQNMPCALRPERRSISCESSRARPALRSVPPICARTASRTADAAGLGVEVAIAGAADRLALHAALRIVQGRLARDALFQPVELALQLVKGGALVVGQGRIAGGIVDRAHLAGDRGAALKKGTEGAHVWAPGVREPVRAAIQQRVPW